MVQSSSTPCVRDRLLDVADRLFYREGIRAVGIDRVLKEADAAKASLYSHFGSKDELIAACLTRRNEDTREKIAAFTAAAAPADRALRYFDYIVASVSAPGFRGCPTQHVVSELSDATHPARLAVAEQRTWLRERFETWAREAGAIDPARTASALLVLSDGAIASAQADGPAHAQEVRRMAATILADASKTRVRATPRPATRTHRR